MSIIPYYKTLLIGDPNVGKTHLIHRLISGIFFAESDKLLIGTGAGVEFTPKTFDLKGKKLKLQIWDPTRIDHYRDILTAKHYRKTVGVFLVYDITKRGSFDNLEKWLKEVKDFRNYEMDQMSLILVGNKSDLGDERQVSYDEGEEFAEENGLKFFETSCRTGANVREVFYKMAELMNEKMESGMIGEDLMVGRQAQNKVEKNESAEVKLEKKQVTPNCTCWS